MRIHGTLEASLTVSGILVPELCDPLRRYWGVERGGSLDVVDAQDLARVRSANRAPRRRQARHPNAERDTR